jgi:malonyl-CoA O-methyltransferase
MNKDLIRQRFAKNLNTYNDNARIQKAMAERLVSFIDNKNPKQILEIGCGTGLLTEIISEKISFEEYIANDIVEDCEEYIKNINSQIEFVSGDIEQAILSSDKKYDLIISNASFQWVENLKEFVEVLISKLNNGGTLLFSTFSKENYREVHRVMGKSLEYFSKKDLEEMFEKYSPYIEEEIRIMAFKTPKEILQHMRSTGVNAIEALSWTKTDMQKFENGYNNYCSGRPTLTYNPIYVKISN